MNKYIKLNSIILLSLLISGCSTPSSSSSSSENSSSINNTSSSLSSSNNESSSFSSSINVESSESSSFSNEEVSSSTSLSEETISSTTSFSSQEDSSSSSTPNYTTLETPQLLLNEENGLVSFTPISGATYYRYYINEGEYLTTTSTSIKLNHGETLCIQADSDDQYTLSSSWSNPISYFEKQIKEQKQITIFFHNTDLSPITINEGETLSLSSPSKEGYVFDSWYLDPFYNEKYTPDMTFYTNTILYAHFNEDDTLSNTSYWIKANDNITSTNQGYFSSSSWKFIPLEKEINNGRRDYVAIVNVNNVTSSSKGEFIILDGFDDNAGRTYWKNGDSNFTINTNGTYKIIFSLETEWLNGSNYVHATIEQLSTTYLGKIPLNSSSTIPYLETPKVNIDKDNNLAYWNYIENATYAYQIDNGEINYTSDNNVSLYEGSFIVVKAISTSSTYQDSKWSTPYIYEERNDLNDDYIYVYFFESGLPSTKINKGETISRPNDPTKAKYTFDNWYKDISRKTLFDFSTPLNKNTVIYPKWIPLNDYKTTTYFTLLDANNNKLGNLTLNEDCLTYNEYHIKHTFNETTSFYINREEDNYKYGPYTINSQGTYNIYFSEEHIWNVNTDKAQNVYYALDTITLYFSDALYWNDIHYYAWDNNNNYKHVWPGESMTYVRTNSYGQNIYKVEIDNSKYTNIIFNGNGKQTVDIDISNCVTGDAFYSKDEKDGSSYKVGTYTYVE